MRREGYSRAATDAIDAPDARQARPAEGGRLIGDAVALMRGPAGMAIFTSV